MTSGVIVLNIKVITGARKTEVCELMADGALKVKLQAKPIEGRANHELIELVADKLKISKSEIEIISGEHARRKTLRLSGLMDENPARIIASLRGVQEP